MALVLEALKGTTSFSAQGSPSRNIANDSDQATEYATNSFSTHAQNAYPWSAGVMTGHTLRKAWRKGPQWFAMIRKHAEVVRDHHLLHKFHKHCGCERLTGMHR